MTKLRPIIAGCVNCTGRMTSTTRTSWVANNAIPDSITMNMTCWNFVLPVEPKVRSIEVGLTSQYTLRILNTIKPVTRVFTVMDAAKLVRTIGKPQVPLYGCTCNTDAEPAVAR